MMILVTPGQHVVNAGTDTGTLVSEFNQLEKEQRDRILGYVAAFSAMKKGDAGELLKSRIQI